MVKRVCFALTGLTSAEISILPTLISADGSVGAICLHVIATLGPVATRPESNLEIGMAIAKKTLNERPDWLSYQALLDTDTHPVPEVLHRINPIDLQPFEIPIERYISRDFFDLEVERLWKRVWQMACREEDIPNVGDNIVYDIAGMSFVVVRSPDAATGAWSAPHFTCPYHGWTYNNRGALIGVSGRRKFGDIDTGSRELIALPSVERAGMIFVPLTPGGSIDLEDYLGGMLGWMARRARRKEGESPTGSVRLLSFLYHCSAQSTIFYCDLFFWHEALAPMSRRTFSSLSLPSVASAVLRSFLNKIIFGGKCCGSSNARPGFAAVLGQ